MRRHDAESSHWLSSNTNTKGRGARTPTKSPRRRIVASPRCGPSRCRVPSFSGIAMPNTPPSNGSRLTTSGSSWTRALTVSSTVYPLQSGGKPRRDASTLRQGRRDVRRSSRSARAIETGVPITCSSSVKAVTNAVFPMPGSPRTASKRVPPLRVSSNVRFKTASSLSRPISVEGPATAGRGSNGRNTAAISPSPSSCNVPCCSKSKVVRLARSVGASQMTPAANAVISRAARFTGAPWTIS